MEEWKRIQGPVLLHHAIVHKFVQNPELRAKLLETGNALLVHTYERDNIFAAGCDKEKMMEWAKNNNGRIIKVFLFSFYYGYIFFNVFNEYLLFRSVLAFIKHFFLIKFLNLVLYI